MSRLSRVTPWFLAALYASGARAQAMTRDSDPRSVVAEARAAVQSGRADSILARWQARLDSNDADRLARLAIGSVAQRRYDYPTADRELGRLSDAAAPADEVTIHALLEHAAGLAGRNRNAEAAALLERARRIASARRARAAEAEAVVRLMGVRARLSGFAAALALTDTARALVPDSGRALLADLLRQRAVFLARLGRADAAPTADSSLTHAHAARDQWAEAQALRARGVVHVLRARNDSAVPLLASAAAKLRALRDQRELAAVLMELATAHLFLARFGDAEDASRDALAAAQLSGNVRVSGQALLGLGNVALNMGDLAAAGRHLEQATRTFERAGDEAMTNLAREHLALLLNARGETARARAEMERARDHHARAGDHYAWFNAQRSVAGFALRAGATEESGRIVRELFAFARANQLESNLPHLWRDLGTVALRRGRLVEAERATRRSLALMDSADHGRRFTARLQLADILERRAAHDLAEQELLAAHDEIDAWRSTLGARQLRALAFQADLSDQLDRASTMARLIGSLARSGRVGSAFAIAERQRARDLADRMLRNAALRRDTAAAAPALTASLSADAVRAALPDERTAIVQFVAGSAGAPTTVFLLTRRAATAWQLPPVDSLAPAIARLVALLESGSDAELEARALGAAILAPLEAELRNARLVVLIPDAQLHRLPFDVLRMPDGRRLLERHTIALAPSATVATRLWGVAHASPRAARLLAFGDPEFDPARELPRLAQSGREARLVARYAPASELRLGARASARYLRNATLDSFTVIHFATHAQVDERSAARTALALAPEAGDSGFVGPGDLAALRLRADLVVLSACRTAHGVLVAGEGVQGLTAPLLQAGARSVVATSWRIGDRGTVDFARDFYDALATGRPVADALREAKLAAIRRGASASEWAAFQVIGDPLVRLSLRRPERPVLPWLLGAVAAGAAAMLLVARARRSGGNDSLQPDSPQR